ncbi:hypothetical protein ABTX62_34115 [Streptomyces sp. NPDC096046]|uniref:hypothetical protein n=1 Tax=Streptomyces sp. NPDC096046 TaxID=3155542 RepID=UPI00331D978F
MSGPLRCVDGTLIVGDQQIAVEADVGVFLPDTGMWGGILRRVPAWLATSLRGAEEVRLRLPTGQVRRIRPLEATHPTGETLVSLAFVGDGAAPL